MRVSEGADASFALVVKGLAVGGFRVQIYVNRSQHGRAGPLQEAENARSQPLGAGRGGGEGGCDIEGDEGMGEQFDAGADKEDLKPGWTDRSAYY